MVGSPPYFKTHTIKVYRIVNDPDRKHYGEPEDRLELVTTVVGDFQPAGQREKLREYGDEDISAYKIYLPFDVDIKYDDRVRIDAEPDLYRVSSKPHKYKLLKYQRVFVQKQEKDYPP